MTETAAEFAKWLRAAAYKWRHRPYQAKVYTEWAERMESRAKEESQIQLDLVEWLKNQEYVE